MSKKSSTVHLEQSTWDEVKEYQKENDNKTINAINSAYDDMPD